MKFKATKIAAAVAASVGVSMAGINAAHSSRIMFPYVGASDTVTSIITVINTRNVPTLHYQIFHKSGSAAFNLNAECEEDSLFRPTSANDIVTFDMTGRFGDDNAVLFEPASTTPVNTQSYAFLRPILDGVPADEPRGVRGWLMVDNLGVGAVLAPLAGSMAGEATLLDFVEGAAWGYSAYQPGLGVNPYDFSDSVESQGEVVAGAYRYTNAALRGGAVGHSPRVPFAIYPIDGDITSRFLVTPINHDVVNFEAAALIPARSNRPGQAGQNTTNLRTRIGLSVLPVGSSLISYDRDENPADGTARRDITCVGAVDVRDMFTPLGRQHLVNGGWSNFRITSPGPLVENIPDAPLLVTAANGARRTFNTNQAVVMKLEFNAVGTFLSEQFKGAFNNGFWLRRGARESISSPVVATTLPFSAGDAVPFMRIAATEKAVATATVESFYEQLGAIDPFSGEPVDVGPTFVVGETISFSN